MSVKFQTMSHNGRHRAEAFMNMGVEIMPVVLRFNQIEVLQDSLPEFVLVEDSKCPSCKEKVWAHMPLPLDGDFTVDNFFEAKEIAWAKKLNRQLRGNKRLSYVTPEHFMILASSRNYPFPGKLDAVEQILRSGGKLATIPAISFSKIAP